MITPNHVSQYLGNKNANLKSGCKTLFRLTVNSLSKAAWEFLLKLIIPMLAENEQLTYVV
jgi:CII-binding regulator of phage lambda lysogenization HflD